MKTLALQGGDLVVGSQGHKTITGSQRIRQDLALALGEPYGNDRFHPTWGSTLPLYVGRPIDPDADMLVRSEVARVVQSYIDTQRAEVLSDGLNGRRTRFTTSDVVSRLNNITTTVLYDAVRVKISLTTQSGENLAIARAVSTT